MNVGCYINGRRPKSKKEIKTALAENPSSVSFDVTDVFGAHPGMRYTAGTMPSGVAYLCGPDPYTKRNFYATVTAKDGKVTVA